MKKILYLIFILLSFFVFVSCKTNEKTNSNVPNQEIIDEIDNYVKLDITYTNTILESTSIEETVDEIYDSVVTIKSYINTQHVGSGSGVLFGYTDELSFIVTCFHVIESCNKFEAVLSDGTTLEAKLVGGDKLSDIAVMCVNETNLTYVSWYEDTNLLRLGTQVICIGNPLGTLPGSVSTGVVSYINREIKVDDYNSLELIQTDVAINSGNSGGGLFNSSGALIGIVNGKYSSSGIEGLGFAIPANLARRIVDDILETAVYNKESNTWITGFVPGRWNLGFELGYGGNVFYRTSIGILSQSNNITCSDYGLLLNNDLFNEIRIVYSDPSKEELVLSNISAQTMTIETVLNFLYSNNLNIGDSIEFLITRNNKSLNVSVELIQYRYYI